MSDTSVIFNILAKDNASAVFGKVGGAMSSMFQGIGQSIGNMGMGALANAFDFAKGAVFDFNSTLENSQIAFTTMLGSGQKAQSFLGDLQTFAKKTPFEFEGLVKNAQNMMGMGIAAKDVIPTLTALGDSVASIGGSAEQVDQVTLAFDQMAAKGTLDMGNMNQLLQGGVPNALRILADSYHVTTGQMIQMISTGKVQSADALPKLIAGLEHGTKSVQGLGGMMDKQSQTFTGALSNIKDGLTQAIAGAFKPFFSIASEGAQKLGAFFSGDAFSAFGDKVSSGIKTAITAVKGFDFSPLIKAFGNVKDVVVKDLLPIGKDLVKTFGPPIKEAFHAIYGALGPVSSALKPIGGALKDVFGFIADHKTTFQALAVGVLAIVAAQKAWTIATSVWSGIQKIAIALQTAWNTVMAMNPIGLIILAIVGLVAAFAYLWTHSAAFRNFWIGLWNDIWGFLKAIGHWFAGPFVDFFVGAWNWIKGAFSTAKDWIVDKFHAITDFIGGLKGKIRSIASGMWDGIKDAFKGAINWIISGWNRLHFSVPSFDTHIPGIGVVGGFAMGLPQIPLLDVGGDVQRSGMAVIHAGERVVPAAQVRSLPAGGGGGGRTTVRFAGNTDTAFATAFMQLVRAGLIQIEAS